MTGLPANCYTLLYFDLSERRLLTTAMRRD